MSSSSLTGPDKSKLRWWLGLFFLALAIPTAVLIQQAHSRLKWEAFHQYRLLAEELSSRVDARLVDMIKTQEARTVADYAFLIVEGELTANFLQRSPLSGFPVSAAIPGLIGYFQVDDQGRFSTPLLPETGGEPAALGLSAEELSQRQSLGERIQQILLQTHLARDEGLEPLPGVHASATAKRRSHDSVVRADLPAGVRIGPAATQTPPGSSVAGRYEERVKQETHSIAEVLRDFDARLRAPLVENTAQVRVEDLELDDRYQRQGVVQARPEAEADSVSRLAPRTTRKERGALPVSRAKAALEGAADPGATPAEVRVSIFESEIDPFELSLLDSGHFVLYRKVWRDGRRLTQGTLLQRDPFLRGLVEAAFRDTTLSRMSELIVAYRGSVLTAFSGQPEKEYLASAADLSGALIYQTRLSAPASELELIFTLSRLPPIPGSGLIIWVAATLSVVLVGGFYLMYRLGARQIELAGQQQDFISAVSHELKTPITSIRMYGEMLREGWANEEKKRHYYDYIHDESERLSRLINNVLQLARMTRNDLQVDLKLVPVAELLDLVRSKICSQIERAGFELRLSCQAGVEQALVWLDTDCFSQVLINLVDNAIKFSARAQQRFIDVSWSQSGDGRVCFSVRDHGPGVPKDQMSKIFQLFYRSENELTRETVGTGIGLALVHQLVLAMDGRIDLRNREPGVEIIVSFPTAT